MNQETQEKRPQPRQRQLPTAKKQSKTAPANKGTAPGKGAAPTTARRGTDAAMARAKAKGKGNTEPGRKLKPLQLRGVNNGRPAAAERGSSEDIVVETNRAMLRRQIPHADQRLGKGKLRITPLGGMREIGKNMSCFEYGQDLIVVDCGLGFPEDDMPGVDIIIPDFNYLRSRASRIRGLFLTHGHEDHIGAVAWFMREFACPVYGTALTVKLLNNKLNDQERGGSSNSDPLMERLHEVKAGDRVQAGVFNVEFIHVNHSIADACALAIGSPAGMVVHSGDFKVDFTPVHGKPMDLNRFAELGNQGVLALFMESTNADRGGTTPSEQTIGVSFSQIFSSIRGRIFVATFSSNVFRMQQIITAAEAQKRKVALLGYSMQKVFEAADSLGYIHYEKNTLVDLKTAEHLPDDAIVYITTGSQGEPMSALSRMAFSEYRLVNIKPGDTVLLSSSMIPGNERSIYRVINELFKSGAQVIHESLAEIHVSGHAYQGELRLMIDLCRPQYFIPAHGEYRHLIKNAQLAQSQEIPLERIFLLNNGDCLELNRDEAEIVGFTDAAGVLIDGSGVGDVDQLVLRERRLLADDGVVSCFMAVDRNKNRLAAEPEVKAVGFIYASENERIVEECCRRIKQYSAKIQQQNKSLALCLQQAALRDQIRDLLYKQTKRRPVVLISVIEV